MSCSASGILGEIAASLRDFFLPPSCLVCGESAGDGGFLCSGCNRAVTGRAASYTPPERALPPADRITVLLPYDPAVRTLIHALKYHGYRSAGVFLGDLIARTRFSRTSVPENTIIVPVPLHPDKLARRGYNQSIEIARGIAAFTGLPVREDIVIRTRDTGTQTALTADERGQNVRGAFRFGGDHHLNGSRIILVDDVLTTGATIAECATVLKDGGAGIVEIAVAASPSPGEESE